MGVKLLDHGWKRPGVLYTESEIQNRNGPEVTVHIEYDFNFFTITRTVNGDRKKPQRMAMKDGVLNVPTSVPNHSKHGNAFKTEWKPVSKFVQKKYEKWISEEILREDMEMQEDIALDLMCE